MALDLNLDLLPWANALREHPAREHRVSGGRGILKTTSGFRLLVLWTLQAKWPGVGVFTAPFRNWCKDLVWDDLNMWLERQPTKVKLGENASDLTIRLIGDKRIELIGLDKYEMRRGLHPVATVNDEVARAKRAAFEEVLGPATLSHKGPVLDITTPRGRTWWMHRWEEGLEADPEIACWKIKSEDVGMVSPKDLAKERETKSPSLYAQEWEGEFTGAEGPLFPAFIDRVYPAGHLIPPGIARQEMERGGYEIMAIDWAWKGTCAVLWAWIGKTGKVMILDEMSFTKTTPAQVIAQSKARRPIPQRLVLDSQCWAASTPDGRNVADSFKRAMGAGRALVQADKRFPASLNRINELLPMDGLDGLPGFSIVNGKAPHLVSQLDELEEDDCKPGGGGFRDKVDCDSMDACRYAVMAARFRPIITVERAEPKRGPLWNRMQAMKHGTFTIDPLTYEPEWRDA